MTFPLDDGQAEYREAAERAQQGLTDPRRTVVAYTVSVAGVMAALGALLASAWR
ncbi:hypothetical protein [Kitasatospora sp. MBT66]|uniref:hypothetical protein n=1 Tax=Kitasatospora sp. MBT66 TaxID=1444769 RepID=UPI000B21DB4B|nr:hypothetical protein [Kitasatospora sp. MBT66]